jgi:hypothetical protein
MFLWKYFDVDQKEVENIQQLFRDRIRPNNNFFQMIDIPLKKFIGIEVERWVLIQVAPKAIGRIHKDWRPEGGQLALQIPLENCNESVTELWESDYNPPIRYTDNGNPYLEFDPVQCKKISEFHLIKPLFFRTDIPHSVSNPSNNIRRAISIRFKQDPWHLL